MHILAQPQAMQIMVLEWSQVLTESSSYIKHTGTKCSYRVLRVPKPMTNTSHPTAERATSGSISYWGKTRTLLSILSKLIK